MTATKKSHHRNNHTISAQEWFDQGRRVWFDPVHKKISPIPTNEKDIAVFERAVNPDPGKRWITMMPGFPDGSYGYSKVESILSKTSNVPRLYVEYVGQGDSDKPSNYKYSTMERADLIEAQWKFHNIRETVLVTFDYSSIVMLELLQRQRDVVPFTRIQRVLAVNGGLFADGHSHPMTTTPLLKTRFGKMGAWMAQRYDWVFDTMLEPLWSKEYHVSKQELRETEAAIRRRDKNGALFLHYAAGFVDEHKQNTERWNLETIFEEYAKNAGITFHLVGSQLDPFEHKQIDLAEKRLGHYENVQVERIPGGHLATSEQADTLASMIRAVAKKKEPDNTAAASSQ